VGVWNSLEEVRKMRSCDAEFTPQMDAAKREALIIGWRKAVGRSLGWEEPVIS